ncbi:MAG: type III pantothenate kinase [Candidatus Coatesbacteria bacterium]|nr:type III pantothenate kinase [Candidatus Coatesbacteria bacterium]
MLKDFRIILDLGHSAIKVALFRGIQLISSSSFSLDKLPEIFVYIENELFPYTRLIGLGWVNYPKYGEFLALVKSSWKIPIVNLADNKTEYIPVNYEPPESLGLDRIANAYAALELFNPPIVVADIGTAVTVDLITDDGFMGGYILPGPKILTECYMNITSQKISIKIPNELPVYLPQSSQEALSFGALITAYGGLKESLDIIRESIKYESLIFTGGFAGYFHSFFEESMVFPNLTLEGYNQMLTWHIEADTE